MRTTVLMTSTSARLQEDQQKHRTKIQYGHNREMEARAFVPIHSQFLCMTLLDRRPEKPIQTRTMSILLIPARLLRSRFNQVSTSKHTLYRLLDRLQAQTRRMSHRPRLSATRIKSSRCLESLRKLQFILTSKSLVKWRTHRCQIGLRHLVVVPLLRSARIRHTDMLLRRRPK